MPNEKPAGIAGVVFVATGDFKMFGSYDPYTGAHDLSDLKQFIETRGGFLRSAVSSKTDYLICNDTTASTKKLQRALELGTPIITEAQFMAMAESTPVIDSEPSNFEIRRNVLQRYNGSESHVVIPESVTTIGEAACFVCSMETLTIPENVTRIEKDAVGSCFRLKSLHILCGKVEIKPSAFRGSRAISEVTLSTDETKAVEAFQCFISIPELKIPLLIYALRQDASSLLRTICAERCVRYKDELIKWIMAHEDVPLLANLFTCFKKKPTLDAINAYIQAAQAFPEMMAFLLRYKHAHYSVVAESAHEQKQFDIELGIMERPLAEWRKLFAISRGRDGYHITKYKGNDACVTIPSAIEGTSVSGIGYGAFDRAKNVIHIDLPDTITHIGDRAFRFCQTLEAVKVPMGVQHIGIEAFYFCDLLKSVVLPEGLTSVGAHAFWKCESLVDIHLPNELTDIGRGAFRDCISITNITIPGKVVCISDEAFSYCKSLENVVIREGVVRIGFAAFFSCPHLTTIHIPKSVTSIFHGAFGDCPHLTIHAPTGSYAEQYAKANNIPFVAE